MRKSLFFGLLVLIGCMTNADVVVDLNQKLEPIKPMHGVNNGPIASGNHENITAFAAAKIPFARTHDASFSEAYGAPHIVDITAIFPDFSKDTDNPESYDFFLTDNYLKRIREAGTEVFYRLGQKIEHPKKKYGIMPPKDFKKWAVICEHIIRHYNEGWANGYKWNIRYWEIWNEADLDVTQWKTDPRTWGGDEQAFQELYRIAAKHLKKCFPHLKIGGPAIAGNEAWADRFLANMQENQVPIDFFSWHIYANEPNQMANRSRKMEALMNKHGYGQAESILNEWNYVRDWHENIDYSKKMNRSIKGGAFNAAVMCVCQNERVDKLMYYDARPETAWNGMFDFYTSRPLRGYYPFLIWGKLQTLGTQVKVTVDEKDVYATAAVGENGKWGLLVCRYNDNDNVSAAEFVKIKVPGGFSENVKGYLTDSYYLFTEIPILVNDNSTELPLAPNSFVYIEG